MPNAAAAHHSELQQKDKKATRTRLQRVSNREALHFVMLSPNDYERARTGPFGCLGTRRFASSVHGGGMDPLGGAGEDMVTAPGRKPVVFEDLALVVLRPARSRGAWWAC